MSDLFLKPKDVDELTGIKTGGTKIADQCKWLKSQRIKHWVNQANKIIIPVAALEGAAVAPEPWKPSV
jgi:hypothetical protein